MKPRLLAIAALAGAWAVPAHAQMVTAQDPGSLVQALQQAGYAAELGSDKIGDPMITSGVSGTPFAILFYNCTDHQACATVQFYVGYEVPDRVGLEKINEWNRSKRFGRSYLDAENDPVLQMDLDLDDGGMSRLLFIDNIEFWSSIVGEFEKHIGHRK